MPSSTKRPLKQQPQGWLAAPGLLLPAPKKPGKVTWEQFQNLLAQRIDLLVRQAEEQGLDPLREIEAVWDQKLNQPFSLKRPSDLARHPELLESLMTNHDLSPSQFPQVAQVTPDLTLRLNEENSLRDWLLSVL